MSYYPFFNVLNFDSFVRLYNYPPNNWESSLKKCANIYVSELKDGIWKNTKIGALNYLESIRLEYSNLGVENLHDGLVVSWLSMENHPELTCELPVPVYPSTTIPFHRGTLGLKGINDIEASYQGEINCFSERGTMLSFFPFVQHDFNNILIFTNLQREPIIKKCTLEIYSYENFTQIGEEIVYTNKSNNIDMNKYNSEVGLLVLMCREMAGIPYCLSYTNDHKSISLEHTHPPASMVIHGNRFKFQNELKSKWYKLMRI